MGPKYWATFGLFRKSLLNKSDLANFWETFELLFIPTSGHTELTISDVRVLSVNQEKWGIFDELLKLTKIERRLNITLTRSAEFGKCNRHLWHVVQRPMSFSWDSLVWPTKSAKCAKTSSQNGHFKKPSCSTATSWCPRVRRFEVVNSRRFKMTSENHKHCTFWHESFCTVSVYLWGSNKLKSYLITIFHVLFPPFR